MNLFSGSGQGGKPVPAPIAGLREKLPAVNSFVDVAIDASGQRQSVAVNEVDATTLITRCPHGLVAGKQVDFLYANPAGRFRFLTVCTRVDGRDAFFALPMTIKTIESFTHRGAARIDKVIPVQWRYAPDGAGYGELTSGSMMDLSAGGASLVVPRDLKIKTQVEVRFALGAKEQKFLEVCEVMRTARIGSSANFSAGIRFLAMSAQNERNLVGFLHELQATRRDRGLV